MKKSKSRPKYHGMVAKDAKKAWLFLLPWILGMVAFYIYPFLNSLVTSFTDATLTGGNWIGLGNYIKMFTSDSRFLNSIKVTTIYVVFGVPLKLVFALLLAVLLKKGATFFRTALYIPSLVGGSVAIAVMWKQLFGKAGMISVLLGIFGIPAKNWIGSPGTALPVLIVLAVWQFGSSMVIFIAGLQNIPKELYEAANVDGAGKVKQFFKITLPLLSPTIQFNLIQQLVGAFQVFTQGYIITEGGPMDSTMFSVLYIFDQELNRMRMGYASAMSWVLFLLISAVSVLVFWSSKYWVFYQNEEK